VKFLACCKSGDRKTANLRRGAVSRARWNRFGGGWLWGEGFRVDAFTVDGMTLVVTLVVFCRELEMKFGSGVWRRVWPSLVAGLLLICQHGGVMAQTRLPKFFSAGMVLQRDTEQRVWGWDTPGKRVDVAWGDRTGTATADDQGRWLVTLASTAAGGPWPLVVEGSERLELGDVWAGDVWLCSGQSNMEWTVAGSANKDAEIAAGNHPAIRHLKVQHRPSATPLDDLETAGWQVCSPATVGDFSAVAYFFARELRTEVDVPIGLIGSNWGGTRIEPWTPPVGFQSVPALEPWATNLGQYPEVRADGSVNHQSPLALYNGMIHPLVQMPIRGAIWYQGESNNGEGMLYRDKMEALISGWRQVWQQPELPVYFVQLAPFNYGGDGQRLAKIWEAQTAALAIPHTGMAVTVDIADLADIHPTNKQDVGKRLALWALAKTYGRDLVYSGPLYRQAEVKDGAMWVEFLYGDTLQTRDGQTRDGQTRDGQAVNELMIAGADRRFFPAQGEIVSESGKSRLKVFSPQVAEPVAVRFAFHQLAQPNLVGGTGLPASPFRTDQWEEVTLPVSLEAYAGNWTFKFTTPDGTAVEHPMQVRVAGRNLSVEMGDGSGAMREVTCQVQPHQLQLKFTVDYQGQPADLTYHVVPSGDKLMGECEYDVSGQRGTFAIEATR